MPLAALTLSLLLAACTEVQPAEVRAALLRGEVDAAAALLADADDPLLAPLRAEAGRWTAVAGQRAALEQASRALLRDSVAQRLAAGELDGAAAHLAAALQAWPEDPTFLALAHELGAAAELAPPDQAVLAWQALAELLAHKPDQAAAWRARAVQAELALAYGRDLDLTLAAWQGIRREAAAHLLRRVDREYLDPPDWGALSRAARSRLKDLSATPGARQRWPRLSDLSWPEPAATEVEGVLQDLDRAVAAGVEAGLPPEVVLAEWVAGALGALDPWTRAVWPAEIAAWQAHHAGVTVGVGLELDLEGEQVVVRQPLLDAPAWQGGVHQDDRLLWIEDSGRLELASLPAQRRLDAAEEALVGEPGSTVTLGLSRGGAPLQRSLVRAPVPLLTVEGLARDADNHWSAWLDAEAGIAYARISAFRDHTEPAFDALVEPLYGQISAVVLDLRGNAGGDVNAAVQIADRFVAGGLLAGVSGRVPPETGPDTDPVTGAKLAAWNEALPGHALEGVPVVVLVDPATASAAEVLAGALQELAGATVVGAPTFGKGQAQALRTELEEGYAVQLTNLAWTLPGGRRLTRAHGGGILPRVRLPAPSPGEDFRVAWLRAERTALRAHPDGTPMRPVGTPARADLPPLDEDPTLLVGLMIARARLLEEEGW